MCSNSKKLDFLFSHKGSSKLKEGNQSIYKENHLKKWSCHFQFQHQHARGGGGGGGGGNEESKQLVSFLKNPNNFQTKVASFQTNQNHKKQRKNHKNKHNAQPQNKIPIPLKKKLLEPHNEWREKM